MICYSPMLWKSKSIRCRPVRLAMYFFLLSSGISFAAPAPPPNDLCSGAEVIPGAGPFPYLSLRIPDISSATTNGDPVLLPTDPCYEVVSRGIWYKFTPATAGYYVLSVNDTATTVADTDMALYTSVKGCEGPFNLITCNDDAGFTQSALGANLLAGTNYYILVWNVTVNPPSPGTAVQLKVSKSVAPPNDLCAGAEVIPSSGPFPYFSSTNDTLLATTNGDPTLPSCAMSPGFRSVWFKFAPTTAGTYVFTTVSNTVTRVFDTMIGIYTSSGACAGPFTALTCNDDSVGLRAAATATLAAGTTYYILVWDMEGADPGYNAVQLAVWQTGAPKPTTLAATNITSTTVTFSAMVNPNASNEVTRTWFEWGTTTSYGSTSAVVNVPFNLVNMPVALSVAVNPIANTTYHFHVGAGNSKGTNFGSDRTFSWSNTRPQLALPQKQTNGVYRVQFSGNPGEVYRLQASSSLPTWSDLGPVTDLGTGTFQYLDFDSVLFGKKFYRVRTP